MSDLKLALESQLSNAQIPFNKMEGRLKRLFSIHQKVQGKETNLEEVYDLVALRVITPSIKELEKI